MNEQKPLTDLRLCLCKRLVKAYLPGDRPRSSGAPNFRRPPELSWGQLQAVYGLQASAVMTSSQPAMSCLAHGDRYLKLLYTAKMAIKRDNCGALLGCAGFLFGMGARDHSLGEISACLKVGRTTTWCPSKAGHRDSQKAQSSSYRAQAIPHEFSGFARVL